MMARQMKDSGVEWIGEIPEDWTLPKTKNLFNIGRGRVISQLDLKDSGYPVYSSQTKNNGCLGYISTYDFDRSQLTWTTDGANAGTVFLREGKHNCTNVCGTLMPKNDKNNLRYMKYSLEYIAFFHKRADTNGYKIMNNEMAEIKITIPPKFIQDKIADFLDEKVGEIDSVIAKTKETIEDYKKYKQAIITDAVTKGLNPNVEMKDTESEWIGEIPAHWDYVRIQRLFEIVDERNDDPNACLLSLYTSLGVKPRSELEEKGNKAVTVMNYKIVKKNDVIVNKLLAWMGAIGYSEYDGVTSPDYDVYRAKKDAPVVKTYYNEYFRHTCFKDDCYKYGHGIMLMRWRTYPEEFLRIKVPNPPLEEQKEIANFLDVKCSEIDKLIAKKEELLTDLENYKKSLIYEYVTGKKEVQKATIIPFPATVSCKDKRFAQAVLLTKILDEFGNYHSGRVKVAKTLYVIENHIGFDFDTDVIRQVAGPLDEKYYKAEAIIRHNNWFSVLTKDGITRYFAQKNKNQYLTYYDRYFKDYDVEIQRIIDIFKNLDMNDAELLATAYASWNDFIIKGISFTQDDIVEDIFSWDDSKKRFSKEKWVEALNDLNKKQLSPMGHGKMTILENRS